MTPEQLVVAKDTQPYHADKFGFANTEFHLGKIEELDQIDSLEDNSVDVIVSNCVINLCPDKEAVLKSCHRLLKPGGELYFSDVYSNRRVPESLRQDEVLWGECLSGALYWNDFQVSRSTCTIVIFFSIIKIHRYIVLSLKCYYDTRPCLFICALESRQALWLR